MYGDFNVAVARFGAFDAQGRTSESVDAAALSQSVFKTMNDQLSSGTTYQIEVLSPNQVQTIGGNTSLARTEAAASLAKQIQADLIVYGNIEFGPAKSQFVPEFYVSPRKLKNAEELQGQYNFGSSIPVPADLLTNINARGRLRASLLARTRALAQFVKGLSDYSENNFDSAAHYFAEAARADGWEEHEGKEVLYLFLGNTAGKRHDLQAAQTYYAHALQLAPEYARARLRAAQVLFQRARDNCEQGHVNVRGLELALQGYQWALSAKVQPPLADIPVKASFGVGRVYLCRSQALIANEWDKAEQAFTGVIQAYEGGNQRVQNLAAEAHAHLGICYSPPADDPNADAKWRRAVAEYQKAIALSMHDDQKADYNSKLGFIYGRLHDYDKADKAYQAAIQLDPDPTRRGEYEAVRRKLQQAPAGLAPLTPTSTAIAR
jgi:tetratricopeptide (TPR) repeat protein